MEFGVLSEEEIKEVVGWWDQRGSPLPEDVLPVDAFAIRESGTLLSAAWLDIAQSGKFGWIQWTTTNPNEGLRAGRSMDLLISGIIKYSELLELRMIMGTCSSHGLGSKFLKSGFSLIHENIQQYFYKL